MMELTVRTQAGRVAPPWAPAATAAARLLSEAGRPDAEVSVLLVDDAAIRALNREWRGKDYATDVLSWPQSDHPMEEGVDLLGDVAISLDTAQAQAIARGWSLADEVALLLIHGILHLLGYEDDTEKAAEQMRVIETRIIGRPLEKTDPDVARGTISP